MSNVVYLPGIRPESLPCELCGQALARVSLQGLYLCEACFRSLEDSQRTVEAPAPAPPQPEPQYSLEHVLTVLTKENG